MSTPAGVIKKFCVLRPTSLQCNVNRFVVLIKYQKFWKIGLYDFVFIAISRCPTKWPFRRQGN